MRLSEAILLGSTIGNFDPSNWNCCLLGQGVRAAGAKHNFLNSEADVRWPWITDVNLVPPQLGRWGLRGPYFGDLHVGHAKEILSNLAFDLQLGKVTREQIVDWVRSVEPKEEVTPVIESIPEAVCA